jgi:hypothetical protein
MAARSVVAGFLMLALAACQPAPASPPPDVEIVIPSGAFQAMVRGEPVSSIPDRIVLTSGQSVVVRNDDQAMHTFADELIWPGQTVRKTFVDRGEFRYSGGTSCSIGADTGITIDVQ